jgi:hypothetical protein
MKAIINKENYESYYLDFLEGNLNENETALLLVFLDKNPSLKVEDSAFSIINSDDEQQLDGFSKSLLKYQVADQKIDLHNIEYFLIASIEKQLSEAKTKELQQFLGKNPAFLFDFQQYQKAHLVADKAIIYPEKQKLKRGIIIPIYARFLAVAAGITLLFSIINLSQIDSSKGLARGRGTNNLKTKVKTEVEKEISTVNIAPNLAETANNFSSSKVEIRKETLIENIEPLAFKTPQKVINQPVSNCLAVACIKPISLEKATDDGNKSTFAAVEMKNPIQPITNIISEAISQQVDYKTTKAAHKKPGGFLFRIGKFEISRKVYDNTSMAVK